MTDGTAQTRGRSPLAWLALAAAAISALGIAVILVGIALDIEGAQEGEEGSVIFGIAWISYLLGAIAALVLGAVALALGRRRGERETERAGTIALGYFLVALVVFVVAAVS